MSRGSSFLRYLLIGLDAVALTAAWIISAAFVPTSGRSVATDVLEAVAFVAGGLVIFGAMGLYRARVCNLRTVEYAHLARGCVVVGLLALAATAISRNMSSGQIAAGAAIAFAFAIVLRSGYRAWLSNQRLVGRYLRSVLLVGTGTECSELVALLTQHPELGYQAVGVVGDWADAQTHGLNASWHGDLDDATAALIETGATGVIICAGDFRSPRITQIVQELLRAGAHVQMSSGLQGVDVGRLRPSPLAHEPFFYVEHVTLASWQLVAKRTIDFTLAWTMLLLALPVLGLAALGIKLQDPGPVFFKQFRIGRYGAPFVVYKLRTMRQGAETETVESLGANMRDGPLTKIKSDPRVTVFGRILRATSIDEIPQLWNVLNGTMSLVGPRPALPNEVAQFDTELRARESVRPGITGLWQVEGRDNPSFAAYRRFDLFYLQNWSVTLDLMILLGTVESVIARAFRALARLDDDIQLAPPMVGDPVIGHVAVAYEGREHG
jgi:exopolysaccharide biosynthesis polyprenyl glycosylphosphotransferase